MFFSEYLDSSLYMLATINPLSKVFLLSTMDPPYSKKEMLSVCLRSSLVAFMILAAMALIGHVMLARVFNIDIFSLRVAGGLVLLLVGMHAVSKGRFYEKDELSKVSDLSIVPLAAPFIAGPGSITVAISIVSESGMIMALCCIFAAVVANLLIMLSSPFIGQAMEKVHATGPAIRITGLLVMAMSVQMMLVGLGEWLKPIIHGHP